MSKQSIVFELWIAFRFLLLSIVLLSTCHFEYNEKSISDYELQSLLT